MTMRNDNKKWQWEMTMRDDNEKWEIKIELWINKKNIFLMSCQIHV